ncbi:hypothetical protein HMSSN139_27960 [Paenibacillus sp. HMSSN-139]|nr:hypothetical protein HMSSN139_27960 [Paenibacillus sp. HMSSN-139]
MAFTMTNVDYSSKTYLAKLDAYWRATNYISVGQLYLKDNPLLLEPLKESDVKVKPIGHWGTIPGQNFIYAHLNRVICKYDLNMFYIEGPGHGGQVMVSNSYLDGSYTEIYPEITQDLQGMKKLFKQFSFPGGVASHAAPETPGSIHEGGELGIRFRTAQARFWTIRTLFRRSLLVTAKPKPDRSRHRGSPTGSSTRSRTEPFCRSCT